MVARTEKQREHRLAWLRPILLPSLIAMVVIVAAGAFLDRQNAVLHHERMQAEVMAKISLIRAQLEGNINGNVQLVRGFVSTLSTEPDMDQDRFTHLVSNLVAENSQLSSISAAPDLVVTLTYPLPENAAILGLDYRNVPEQFDTIATARDTGEFVLAGPLDLVQGGVGLIARFPVFTGEGDTRRFWGIVSAVIGLEQLFIDSDVTRSSSDLEVSLTKLGSDASRQLFFGDDLSDLQPVRAIVSLPRGAWEVAAVPRDGWAENTINTWLFRLSIVVAAVLILLPIVVTGILVGERQLHFRQLKARERELAKLSHRLGLALDVSKVGVWELDPETGTETWDARTNELYGLPSDGGKRSHDDWRAAVHPDDHGRAEKDFRDMIAETGRYESDYRVVLPDGRLRHVRSIAALHHQPGLPDKIVGVNWDMTADVELTADLRRANQLTDARNRELEAARESLEYNALHDSLTGLPNRRYLEQKLEHLADDNGTSMALLHIDLDRFKQINDTLGHAAGDAMLVHAAAVLRHICKDSDFVARIGGDEFVVLTVASDSDHALGVLAERIVRQMRQPTTFEGHECRFGVSIGIAADRSADADGKRLLINADIALYRAKARGRDRFEFFSEALQAEVVNTKRVADEILNAVERNEFVAWFQPQFDATTFDVIGVEALARWQHPTEGVKPPAAFMQIAEELNVVSTIDRIILDQTLAAMKHWDEIGISIPRASVNVSLRRLNDEDLIKGLRQLDIEPGRLSFELVESIYLDDRDPVVASNIERIKSLGIDIEIDDFGTGYASIISLQKLRPKRLKIDRQLVMPILVDQAQRELLASIIDIGKSMGIEVVAEGVETMEHARALRDLGCDILQGYGFSRPLSAADLEAFLKANAWRRAS